MTAPRAGWRADGVVEWDAALWQAAPEDRIEPAFAIERPDALRWPIVLNSPHSGRAYPAGFLARAQLDLRSLRGSEDAFVDELARPLVARGAPLLHALFPRAYLDVNREPLELDPRLFGALPPGANTRSVRVAAGLGTVARMVSDTREIYRTPPTLAEAMARIHAYYRPYHRALADLVAEVRARFGVCVLVDLHSMPSMGARTHGAAQRRADYVVGDRHGASCAPAVSRAVQGALERSGVPAGVSGGVRRNAPYAGGFITESYGRPLEGVHAVQIEINRALYMDEARIMPLPASRTARGVLGVQSDLLAVFNALTRLDFEALRPREMPLAAE